MRLVRAQLFCDEGRIDRQTDRRQTDGQTERQTDRQIWRS